VRHPNDEDWRKLIERLEELRDWVRSNVDFHEFQEAYERLGMTNNALLAVNQGVSDFGEMAIRAGATHAPALSNMEGLSTRENRLAWALRGRITYREEVDLGRATLGFEISPELRAFIRENGVSLGALALWFASGQGNRGGNTPFETDDETWLRKAHAMAGIGVAAGFGVPLWRARLMRLGLARRVRLGRTAVPMAERTWAEHATIMRRAGMTSAADDLTRFMERSKATRVVFRGDNQGHYINGQF
jgi:hypothetical protein